MKNFTLLGCLLGAALLCGCGPGTGPGAPAAPPVAEGPLKVISRADAGGGVRVANLCNGLTVIVAENRSAPVVTARLHVRMGGMYEGNHLGSGISHLCEHLVSKGEEHEGEPPAGRAPAGGPSPLDRIGGQSNAATSQTQTMYYVSADSSKAMECIDLLAGWIVRPEFTEADFRREHGVVQRELELQLDNPRRHMWQVQAKNLYGAHPAAVPIIGYRKPLADLAYADVREFFRRAYVPQNMFVVVAGDVDPEAVLARVCKSFAGLAPGRAPDLSLPEVPPVAATRRVVTTHPAARQTTQDICFRTIPLIHPDLYALDVLSYVLTNGESSRLHAAVRRRLRLVTGISSSSWTPAWGAGWFSIDFQCAPAQAEKAEKAILEELRKVVSDGVTAEELARAKRQKVADYVQSQQTVESQAGTLVEDLMSTGDVGFSRDYTDRIQEVTAEQVRAAARKYLDFERMVITRMDPPTPAGAAAAAGKPAPRAKVETFKLPNGLPVVLCATASTQLVSAALVSLGGVLVETDATNGLGTLMTALATKGAGGLSAEQIADLFDSAGGSVSGSCGYNTFYWQFTVLADSFEKALPVFADVVIRPTHPAGELEILRPTLVAAIRQAEASASGRLQTHFAKDFFGETPLSRRPLGSEKAVAAAGREAIAGWHKRHVKAGSSVLAVYGNFDPAATRKRIEELFASMPAGRTATPQGQRRTVAPAGEVHAHPTDLAGAGVIVAVPGMRLDDLADRPAITVLDTIISGYRLPRGWLHSDLRGGRLVYVVHAYNLAALVPGAFVTYAMCEPDKADRVAEIIRKNYRLTLTHSFTAEEVEVAVNYILTADALDNQTMSARAMQAALDELYGFGYDFQAKYAAMLRAVTPADVARVAKKYFSGGCVTTIVSPAVKAEAPAAETDAPVGK